MLSGTVIDADQNQKKSGDQSGENTDATYYRNHVLAHGFLPLFNSRERTCFVVRRLYVRLPWTSPPVCEALAFGLLVGDGRAFRVL